MGALVVVQAEYGERGEGAHYARENGTEAIVLQIERAELGQRVHLWRQSLERILAEVEVAQRSERGDRPGQGGDLVLAEVQLLQPCVSRDDPGVRTFKLGVSLLISSPTAVILLSRRLREISALSSLNDRGTAVTTLPSRFRA